MNSKTIMPLLTLAGITAGSAVFIHLKTGKRKKVGAERFYTCYAGKSTLADGTTQYKILGEEIVKSLLDQTMDNGEICRKYALDKLTPVGKIYTMEYIMNHPKMKNSSGVLFVNYCIHNWNMLAEETEKSKCTPTSFSEWIRLATWAIAVDDKHKYKLIRTNMVFPHFNNASKVIANWDEIICAE